GVGSIWKFKPAGGVVIRGRRLMAFLGDMGLQWERELTKKECQAHGLFWTDSGLLASCRHAKGVVVSLFDVTSGSVLWTKDLKHNVNKLGLVPAGMAVTDSRVILTANKRVLGFDLGTGTEIFDLKLKKKIAENIRELRQMSHHFVLIGRTEVTAHSIETGEEIWKKEDFDDPYLLKQELQKAVLSMGIALAHQTISQAQHNMDVAKGIDANSVASRAKYKQGSISYSQHMANVQSNISSSMVGAKSAEIQMQGQAFGAMTGPGAYELISKFTNILIQTDNKRMPRHQAFLYRNLTENRYSKQFASALTGVLLDLETGKMTEAPIRQAKNQACSTKVILDPEGHQLIQFSEQIALLCKTENEIDAYRFP
ncbi:MAG: PQQ-binding-like beta-propeller repeat protein, partial [bacterium]|nr:PQQ-binding-like beta-propeller repeat protein [bacterium]